MEKNDMQELSLDQLEQVQGGATVNTGMDGVNAAVRNGPGINNKQIASLANGTEVHVISDLIYDSESGRHFVQISYVDKKGFTQTGWIASSIVGLMR